VLIAHNDKIKNFMYESDEIMDANTLPHQQREWLQDLTVLRRQIKESGGLQVGLTKETVIAQLHRVRREIFDAEYAHLYR